MQSCAAGRMADALRFGHRGEFSWYISLSPDSDATCALDIPLSNEAAAFELPRGILAGQTQLPGPTVHVSQTAGQSERYHSRVGSPTGRHMGTTKVGE